MANQNFDILIIGGGVMGSSIAYNLVNDGFKGRIAVLEKDPTYERSSTTLSAGGIRRQFSTEVNVRMSQYSLSIFQKFGELMEVKGERPEIELKPLGYLFLGNEKNWPLLVKHQHFQKSLGVDTQLLDMKATFQIIPDLNPEGLVGSSYSPGDGYMDPYSVLQGYAKKARNLGVQYLSKEVIWPDIAFRIPLFDELKLIRGWAGLYEVNQWDNNAILGQHPELHGFFMAVGFSGHGFQQAPAVGKALSELIRLGRYETVDVSSLGFKRILQGEKVLEEEVV